jgi:peptidoglycan L-alanyl-D-glutamate endopeptidase CwlK
MKCRLRITINTILLYGLVLLSAAIETAPHTRNRGTLLNPIVDSAMTAEEAFIGLDPNCPEEIRRRLKIVKVLYYSTDKKIHQGQLVIDSELQSDIQMVFKLALKEHFPIYSVIPMSDHRFRNDGLWDDELSMKVNNTSAFNWRVRTGGSHLSSHAYGRAVDINPVQNPYIKGNIILPPSARYTPTAAGTLTADHMIVRAFKQMGWKWGGDWVRPKDYQHFEKPLLKSKQ